jgi:hypothetical protein
VDCQLHEVLQAPEAAIMQVYFPETIGVSRLASMINGDVVEVGQVGHEGMVGLPVVLGNGFHDLEAMGQNPSTALRLAPRRCGRSWSASRSSVRCCCATCWCTATRWPAPPSVTAGTRSPGGWSAGC